MFVGLPRRLNILALVDAVPLSFRNLGCQRVSIHKHMFLTYILNSITILIHLIQVVPNGKFVNSNPVSTALFAFDFIFKDVVFVNGEHGVIV